jgi:branched-chain amino acid transport system substrate-binding protein
VSPSRRRMLLSLAALPAAGLPVTARAAPNRPGAQPAAGPTGLVIGAALPLTGAFALVGDEALRGLRLAAAAQNAAGGINNAPVGLAIGDIVDQSQAAAAVNQLIRDGHAGLLLGAGSSDFCYPASAAAELAQIPYIELTAPAAGITNRGFRFLRRTGPTTGMIAELVTASVQARFAGRRLGLLFNTGATGGAIAAALLAHPAATPPTLTIGYPPDGADLFDSIGRLKRAGVELLVHAAGPADVLAAWSAMAQIGWQPHGLIGCGDGYLLRESAAAIGPAFEGALVIGPPATGAQAAAVQAAYLAAYGAPPRGPESLAAYAGALLVFQTLAGLGGDPTRLPATLDARTLPPGSLANGWGARFDNTGQNLASFVSLQKWRGGALEVA